MPTRLAAKPRRKSRLPSTGSSAPSGGAGLTRFACAGLLVATVAGCAPDESAEPSGTGGATGDPWQPSIAYPTPREPGPRGHLDRRGLVHAHSVYSHDACDDAPRDPVTGAINQPCYEDFRRGLCQTRHDFVMLTDHKESFADTEFPDVLLYDGTRGDTLIDRGGGPTASWLACPDAAPALVMAGAESGTMPVGLERHVASTPSERSALYGASTPEAIAAHRAEGAVVLVAHTEDWTVDQLATLPLDGFEAYNLHANLYLGAGAMIGLIADLKTPEELPHSDLVFLPIVSEDDRYVGTWAKVLARGVKRVTTLGTDCHRNTLKELLPDGERMDSYRRMMLWFSNHVLITPDASGGFTDLEIKEALRAGRSYGAFEVLGYPLGFDFRAEAGATTAEMGAELALADGFELRVTRPTVQQLDPDAEPPEIRVRLLRATDAGWEQVAESLDDLTHSPAATGAYRAEIRIRPRHLLGQLGAYTELAEKDFVWIYSNPIYLK